MPRRADPARKRKSEGARGVGSLFHSCLIPQLALCGHRRAAERTQVFQTESAIASGGNGRESARLRPDLPSISIARLRPMQDQALTRHQPKHGATELNGSLRSEIKINGFLFEVTSFSNPFFLHRLVTKPSGALSRSASNLTSQPKDRGAL